MSGIPRFTRADLAREDKALEMVASQFPKCLTCAPDEKPKRCDSSRCHSEAKCNAAINESLHICGRTTELHFRHELDAIEWIGNQRHKEKHLEAHHGLAEHLASITEAYEPSGNRLHTIEAIKAWGDELHDHMKTLDLEMRTLWAKRESQVI